MARYSGGCHCGRIKVEFVTELEPEAFVPRADGCGFCLRHRAMAMSDPRGGIELQLPADPPEPYRFGLGITDFHLCDRCGVWVAAIWHNGDRAYGVVNLPALDQSAKFTHEPVSVDFDGEDVAAREARRLANWTPARIITARN
jgi:hypothetical protein